MNDALTQKVVEILTQLQGAAGKAVEMAGKAAPQVAEYAIKTKVYEGIATLMQGGSSLLFALITLTVMYRKRKTIVEAFDDDSPAVVIATFAFGIASFIAFCAGTATLCNAWNWVAVFDPKIALAHDIVQRVMGQQ